MGAPRQRPVGRRAARLRRAHRSAAAGRSTSTTTTCPIERVRTSSSPRAPSRSTRARARAPARRERPPGHAARAPRPVSARRLTRLPRRRSVPSTRVITGGVPGCSARRSTRGGCACGPRPAFFGAGSASSTESSSTSASAGRTCVDARWAPRGRSTSGTRAGRRMPRHRLRSARSSLVRSTGAAGSDTSAGPAPASRGGDDRVDAAREPGAVPWLLAGVDGAASPVARMPAARSPSRRPARGIRLDRLVLGVRDRRRGDLRERVLDVLGDRVRPGVRLRLRRAGRRCRLPPRVAATTATATAALDLLRRAVLHDGLVVHDDAAAGADLARLAERSRAGRGRASCGSSARGRAR